MRIGGFSTASTFAITGGIGRRAEGALTKTVRVDGVVMRHCLPRICFGPSQMEMFLLKYDVT